MDAHDSQLLSSQEIAERGEAIYRERYEAEMLRTSQGKFVAINVRDGSATVGDSVTEAAKLASAAHPDGLFHIVRVGRPGAIEAGWYMSRAS